MFFCMADVKRDGTLQVINTTQEGHDNLLALLHEAVISRTGEDMEHPEWVVYSVKNYYRYATEDQQKAFKLLVNRDHFSARIEEYAEEVLGLEYKPGDPDAEKVEKRIKNQLRAFRRDFKLHHFPIVVNLDPGKEWVSLRINSLD